MKRATSNYLKRVSDVAKHGFPSAEEEESCLENVFAELEEGGLPMCQCPETSVIVEQFVRMARVKDVDSLFKILMKDIAIVLKDRYASHVLETTLLCASKFIHDNVLTFSLHEQECNSDVDTVTDTQHFEKAEDSIINKMIEMSKIFLDEIELHLTDSYSSHVLRMLLQVLGGTSVECKINRQKRGLKNVQETSKFSDFEVPELFIKRLRKLGKHMFKLDKFSNLLLDPHASAVIQVMLLVFHKVNGELCQKYIKKLIKLAKISKEDVSDIKHLPPVTTDKVGSFLVQQIISLASPEVYSELFNQLFKGSMIQYAIHPKANFVLQSLLTSCTDKVIFREQFEEFQDNFEDILAYGHYGVMVALVKTSQKLECKQKPFKQSLMSALHCRDPQARQKRVAVLALTMRTYEIYYNLPEEEVTQETENREKVQTQEVALNESDINYSGSMLLQEMLRFTGTKLVVESLLDMTAADLSTLSCNSFGSYLLETFFQSKTVAKTAKDALIAQWKSECIRIACNRIGCQSIQSLWRHLNLTQKCSVAEELCKDEIKVRSDQFGKFVYSNLALQHFKKRPKDWEYIQQQEVKTRKLFTDIIGKDFPSKRHKKQKGRQIEETGEFLRGDIETEDMEDTRLHEKPKGPLSYGGRGRGGWGHHSRGKGNDHFMGGSSGRRNQLRGGQRGRGDNRFRDNHKGSYVARGGRHDQVDSAGSERGNFRGRSNFRGVGGNRDEGRGKFVRREDGEEAKSASLGSTGKKKPAGRS